ncbi:MAG: phosphoribosylformylglycinamidine synthase [Proteobacteria bacterium]|nr:phosphoribosylformylglycinamidine synthase [Pseudomonadota bacterium]
MTFRIKVLTKVKDARADVLKSRFGLSGLKIMDVYTVDKPFAPDVRKRIAHALHNPVAQEVFVLGDDMAEPAGYTQMLGPFDSAVETGYLPGVTDNVGKTARQLIEDLTGEAFAIEEGVYSGRIYLIQGDQKLNKAKQLAHDLTNPLVHSAHVMSKADMAAGKRVVSVPRVRLAGSDTVLSVDLNVDDTALGTIGKQGITGADGKLRGPLGLDLPAMKVIQAHYAKLGRNPTDVELETLAQTWSEHCKHTIFAAKMDNLSEGLYKGYIKKATEEVRRRKGKDDICVSVFSDNAGGIVFDDDWVICDKVETHNTPSALDPFGGAMTGIVGVNRDCIGFGLGAKPILNRYGFCLAYPENRHELFRDAKRKQPLPSAHAIMDGVIKGVEAGGNCSGIPTPQGFLYFDDRYRAKPLVFCGTIGLLPRTLNGKPAHEKKANPGDVIIMAGGRVGADGIHGATFSSEALDEGSPATAVQIGDPITQKKLSDALLREVRGQGLYTSITDNGAGGLSSSVGEMGRESGGFEVDLDKVPLKYAGLEPWQIWVSESQERMTLAVPPAHVDTLIALLKSRDVEATPIGTFTDSGKAVVRYKGKVVMEMAMAFLHDGLPQKELKTRIAPPLSVEPEIDLPEDPADVEEALLDMLAHPNIRSHAFVSTLFDHEVQGTSVLKPLQGAGQVNGDATIIRPLPTSWKGVAVSQGIFPRYGDIDTAAMTAVGIDFAIRAIIAAGGDMDNIALLDNFCWCSPDDPKRLWQLTRSAKACYEYAVQFEVPFISGKDSMYNDFKGYDHTGEAIKLSAPPTVLISAVGVVPDVRKVVSLEPKMRGDHVYVLGLTGDELGGSIFYDLFDELGRKTPQVFGREARNLYQAISKATAKELVASALPLGRGGLAVAAGKAVVAGGLGLKLNLADVPTTEDVVRDDTILFSESASRLLVTVAPEHKNAFEKLMHGVDWARIGVVIDEPELIIHGTDAEVTFMWERAELEEAYKTPYEGFASNV